MTTRTETQQTLRELIEIDRDAEKGFLESADKIDNPTTASEFRQFAVERARFANELVEIGETVQLADEGGSMAAALHRAWIDLKDAFTRGDHAILAAAGAGEDQAVAAYEKALDRDLPQDIEEVVRRQYERVKQAHDRVRTLRDAAA